MKKLILLMSLIIIAVFSEYACAAPPVKIKWYDNGIHTVGWTPITDYEDGTLITGGLVNYHIFVRPPNDTTMQLVKEIGTTQETETDIYLAPGDKYLVGVAAEAPDVNISDIAWSDVQDDCLNGIIFGIQYVKGVGKKPGKPQITIY